MEIAANPYCKLNTIIMLHFKKDFRMHLTYYNNSVTKVLSEKRYQLKL